MAEGKISLERKPFEGVYGLYGWRSSCSELTTNFISMVRYLRGVRGIY